ncbi:MAG: DUF4410 domain-containing protein [Planctomycetota bacterium]
MRFQLSDGPSSRRGAALAALAFLLTAVGCTYPKPTATYEFLTDYERMSGENEPLVSLVYAPESVSLGDYRGVVVGPVTVGRGWVEDRERALHYATFFRACLRAELASLKKFDFVEFQLPPGPAAQAGEAVKIEGRITRFDMGSGFLRYLTGLLIVFRGGATDLQFEGRLSDAVSGDVLMELADRRRHYANTPYGPNPRNFREGFGMKVTMRETADCLARFVKAAYRAYPLKQQDGEKAAPEQLQLASEGPDGG